MTTLPAAQSDKDIYLLSAVLHSFDDETCVALLRNVATACGQAGARIALLEMVLPEVGTDVAGHSAEDC